MIIPWKVAVTGLSLGIPSKGVVCLPGDPRVFFAQSFRTGKHLRNRAPRRVWARFARLALVLALTCGILSLVWAVPPARVGYAAQPEAKEYELKAVYLYNFLQFFQWPAAKRSASRDGAMVIGVVGESPFGAALDDLEKNVHQSGMKPVRFVYFANSRASLPEKRELTDCDLLFIASSEKHRFGSIVASLNDAPVLTVADSEGFLASGGMINLVRSGGKIRWMINRAPMERSGLRVSAQLLSMAIKVYDGD
jgi:YfiR/HmsC-like